MSIQVRAAYTLFPYERRFLRREVRALGGHVTATRDRVWSVRGIGESKSRLLTYATTVQNGSPSPVPTMQAIRESAARAVQQTRYGPHGIHEYKGKFNPQTPRSLLLQTRRLLNSKYPVLDPFSGSGTALVEWRDLGRRCEGVELNPLAVMIARAKLSWHTTPRARVPTVAELDSLQPRSIPAPDRAYLEKWFPKDTLDDALRVRTWFEALGRADRAVASVVLSNLLREYSWQDPSDLRIRRRTSIPDQEGILSRLVSRITTQWNARRNWNCEHPRTSARVLIGDSRFLNRVRGDEPVAGTITSPPYATALPYVDTYRLSKVLLGLVKPSEVGPLERMLIGARDVEGPIAADVLSRIDELPRLCAQLVRQIRSAVDADQSAGFRKRAVPITLAKYFLDMQAVLVELRDVERAHAPNLWVIGPNRTTVGGRAVLIDTPRLVGELAKAAGFSRVSCERLDAYSRYDLHSENSIRSESLLRFYG